MDKTQKEVTCKCAEAPCGKRCSGKHTHKTFFCEKCEPEACKKMYSKTPKERFDERFANDFLFSFWQEYTNTMNGNDRDVVIEKHTQKLVAEWNTMIDEVIAEIDTNLKNNSDYNKGVCDAQNIIRRHYIPKMMQKEFPNHSGEYIIDGYSFSDCEFS
jgi:hypothetical protein